MFPSPVDAHLSSAVPESSTTSRWGCIGAKGRMISQALWAKRSAVAHKVALPFQATQHPWLKFTFWSTITPTPSAGLFVSVWLIISQVGRIAFSVFFQIVSPICPDHFSHQAHLLCFPALTKSHQDWTPCIASHVGKQELSDSKRAFLKLSYESVKTTFIFLPS